MSREASSSLAMKLRGFGHGVGEVGGFLAAGAIALFELCFGRWPGAFERRRRAGQLDECPDASESDAP